MTVEQIEARSKKFQERALGLLELMPKSDLLDYSTLLKRHAKHLHDLFKKLVTARSLEVFWTTLEKMEEVMDDLVFELDRLHDVNCVMQIKAVDEFIKFGYNLLSIYSISCDQLIKAKTKEHKLI
ncbi:MAG: hypothetical protein AAGA85_15525 [Bacteroidota bacterium]